MRDGAGMQYIFTAVFTKDADGLLVANFPDIPGCTAKGPTMLEAVQKAGSVLSLCLFDMEQQGIPIPKARYPDEIVTNDGEIASVIVADTYKYHLRFGNKTVESEISMPAWLGDAIKSSKLDLSQIFQDAIKREMGMPVFTGNKETKGSKGSKKATPVKEPEPFFDETPEQQTFAGLVEDFFDEPQEEPSAVFTEEPELRKEEVKPAVAVAVVKPAKPSKKSKKQAVQERKPANEEPVALPTRPLQREDTRPLDVRPQRDTRPLRETPRLKEPRKPRDEDDLSMANKFAIVVMYVFIIATIVVVIVAALLVFTSVLDDMRVFGSRPLVGSVIGSEVATDTNGNGPAAPVVSEIDIFRSRLNNDDIVGVLTVEDTSINYAIVQSGDDDFYRMHNIRKEPCRYGRIFLSSLADVANPSGNTVLYGRTPSGSMFYDINLFADYRFFSQSPNIRFVTNYGDFNWEVFSFYSDISEHDFNVIDSENWGAQVQIFANRSVHPSNVVVGENDKILTLVAECADGGAARYILHARLVN